MHLPETAPADCVARRIATILRERGCDAEVADVRIGLGYTAVLLADDRMGAAYTFSEEVRDGCSVFDGLRPLAGRSAMDLLPLLESADPIEAAVGLAGANALANRPSASFQDGDILDHLDLRADDQVGVVGHFAPILETLRRRVRSLTVFERIQKPRGQLRPAEEIQNSLPWCQVAVITATSIINQTIDGLLEAAGRCREVAILGASTPMLAEAFSNTNVTVLSGVVVENPAAVLRIVSEGGGMRYFKPHVRKVNRLLR